MPVPKSRVESHPKPVNQMDSTSVATASTLANKYHFIADHAVLDFLNTVPLVDGSLVDLLTCDKDVLEWLRSAGFSTEDQVDRTKPTALLESARQLRDVIRTLVTRHEAGKSIHPDALNAYLAEARSYLQLSQKKDGTLELQRRWKQRTPEEILAPLAQSAAELLAEGDFALVRKCESEQCVLWFYDRTKSHQRRWCSMAMCGNRHKVAAFRQRKQQAT